MLKKPISNKLCRPHHSPPEREGLGGKRRRSIKKAGKKGGPGKAPRAVHLVRGTAAERVEHVKEDKGGEGHGGVPLGDAPVLFHLRLKDIQGACQRAGCR